MIFIHKSLYNLTRHQRTHYMRKRLFACCSLGLGLFAAAYIASMSVEIPKAVLTASPVAQVEQKTFDKRKHCLENIHCRTLAEAVFHESRSEPEKAQIMVASVILNRRDALRWPNDVYNVVHQKRRGVCQFSYVCQLSKSEQQSRIAKEPKAWSKAVDISYRVYHYEETFDKKVDHFYNPKRVKRKPRFASEYQYAGKYGSHLFYASN